MSVQITDAEELRAIIREMLDIVELFLVEKTGGDAVGPEALNLMNLYCGSLKPLVQEEGDDSGSAVNDRDPVAEAGDDQPVPGGADGPDLPQPEGADALL